MVKEREGREKVKQTVELGETRRNQGLSIINTAIDALHIIRIGTTHANDLSGVVYDTAFGN